MKNPWYEQSLDQCNQYSYFHLNSPSTFPFETPFLMDLGVEVGFYGDIGRMVGFITISINVHVHSGQCLGR